MSHPALKRARVMYPEVGDIVEALWDGGSCYYLGTITAVIPPKTSKRTPKFDIHYHDGETELGVDWDLLRPPSDGSGRDWTVPRDGEAEPEPEPAAPARPAQSHPCESCGRVFTTAQGRAAHRRFAVECGGGVEKKKKPPPPKPKAPRASKPKPPPPPAPAPEPPAPRPEKRPLVLSDSDSDDDVILGEACHDIRAASAPPPLTASGHRRRQHCSRLLEYYSLINI